MKEVFTLTRKTNNGTNKKEFATTSKNLAEIIKNVESFLQDGGYLLDSYLDVCDPDYAELEEVEEIFKKGA